MNLGRRVISLLIGAALLLLSAGCRTEEEKPLWQQLEEAQYLSLIHI